MQKKTSKRLRVNAERGTDPYPEQFKAAAFVNYFIWEAERDNFQEERLINITELFWRWQKKDGRAV